MTPFRCRALLLPSHGAWSIHPILQMGTLRFREVLYLASGGVKVGTQELLASGPVLRAPVSKALESPSLWSLLQG